MIVSEAGKRRSGKIRKGSVWLRRGLCQAAWAASRTKNTYLAALYRRLIARRGKKRTIVAVAHTMLIIAYHILKRGCPYQELGGDYFHRLDAKGTPKAPRQQTDESRIRGNAHTGDRTGSPITVGFSKTVEYFEGASYSSPERILQEYAM